MRHLILLLPMAFAACATTGSGGVVAIDTATHGQALAGASCTVSNNSGNWTVTTPASLAIGAPSGDLRVVCNKEGYRTSEVIYRPGYGYGGGGSSVGLGVGGFGSHVGVGLGMSVPVGGGGGRGYPDRITVDMNAQ